MCFRNLICWSLIAAGELLAYCCAIGGPESLAAEPSSATPLMAKLDRFSAVDVPALGPAESEVCAAQVGSADSVRPARQGIGPASDAVRRRGL